MLKLFLTSATAWWTPVGWNRIPRYLSPEGWGRRQGRPCYGPPDARLALKCAHLLLLISIRLGSKKRHLMKRRPELFQPRRPGYFWFVNVMPVSDDCNLHTNSSITALNRMGESGSPCFISLRIEMGVVVLLCYGGSRSASTPRRCSALCIISCGTVSKARRRSRVVM